MDDDIDIQDKIEDISHSLLDTQEDSSFGESSNFSTQALVDSPDFYNKVQFPSTLRSAVGPDHESDYSSTALDYPFACFNVYYLPSFNEFVTYSAYYRPTSTSSYTRVVGYFDSQGSWHFLQSTSPTVSNASCFAPSTPVYYGVEPSSDIILPATLLSIAFFVLIYKMLKRVLF